jgi:hypothetical protein
MPRPSPRWSPRRRLARPVCRRAADRLAVPAPGPPGWLAEPPAPGRPSHAPRRPTAALERPRRRHPHRPAQRPPAAPPASRAARHVEPPPTPATAPAPGTPHCGLPPGCTVEPVRRRARRPTELRGRGGPVPCRPAGQHAAGRGRSPTRTPAGQPRSTAGTPLPAHPAAPRRRGTAAGPAPRNHRIRWAAADPAVGATPHPVCRWATRCTVTEPRWPHSCAQRSRPSPAPQCLACAHRSARVQRLSPGRTAQHRVRSPRAGVPIPPGCPNTPTTRWRLRPAPRGRVPRRRRSADR